MDTDFALAPTGRFERAPRSDTHALEGRPRAIHRLLSVAIATCALVGAIGYALPAHRIGREPFHSNLADGGLLSLLLLCVVAVAALVLRGRRLGSGMLAGAVAMLGSALAFAPVLVVHLVDHPTNAVGQYLFTGGIIATFVAGAALAIAEPLLYATKR